MPLNDISIAPGQEIDVASLEAVMLAEKQVDCPVIHRFGPGIYIREVRIPAGAVAIGHYQKTRHLNVFLQGRVTMLNTDGTRTDLAAPMIFTGEPGRKVGFIHEDVVWLNVYATEETDVETLESMFLDKSDAFYDSVPDLDRKEDRADYLQAIKDLGFTQEEIDKQVFDESDQRDMPEGSYKFSIAKSGIHGKGVFASAPIEAGEVIGPGRIDGLRTPIGRFTNHAKSPNAHMENIGGDIYLVANRDIAGCQGGLNGEEITTDYRHNFQVISGDKSCQE